jgi:hypothetical protein
VRRIEFVGDRLETACHPIPPSMLRRRVPASPTGTRERGFANATPRSVTVAGLDRGGHVPGPARVARPRRKPVPLRMVGAVIIR